MYIYSIQAFNFITQYLLFFQVVLRSFPVGTCHTGSAAIHRGGSIWNDGVSSRWIPSCSAETLSWWIVRLHGSLLAWSFQGSADYASVARLFARFSRCSRRIHLNRPSAYDSSTAYNISVQIYATLHTRLIKKIRLDRIADYESPDKCNEV